MKVRTKEVYGEYNQILSVVFSMDISEENYNSERSIHPKCSLQHFYNSQDMVTNKCPSAKEWIKNM